MPELVTPAVLRQQVPPNEIRQARAGLEMLMPGDRAAWSKLSPCEEIADLLKRSAVLQGNAHQAGDYVVEANQFIGTVRTLHSEKGFYRSLVVMDAEVERALGSDFHFLRDVVAAGGESATTWNRVFYIGHAFCNPL